MSSYYLSKKSISLWMSLLFSVIAVFAGLRYFSMMGNAHIGIMEKTGIVGIPVSAALFGILVLIFGKRKLGTTILPVVTGTISLAALSSGILPGGTILLVGIIYLLVIFNIIKTNTLLVYILGVSTIFHLAGLVGCYMADGQIPVQNLIFFTVVAAFLFGVIGMRRDHNGFTLTWTDRAYGRRVRSMPPMSQIEPYFMPTRIGAQNLIKDTLELSKIDEYIAGKRKEGLKGFGFMHVFMTAYLRVIAMYPGANRFLAGQRVFSRFNCIISFVVKKEMTAEAPDTVAKLTFKPGVSANEVYEKVAEFISENKHGQEDNTFDSVAKLFSYVPGVLLKFVVWFIKLLDYFGLLPTALEDVSPFHGSMFFTSMASLGIPVINHHLYDFGNVPVFCAFGKKYKKNEIEKDGSVVTKKFIDYSVSVDERICDGFYFAMVLKEFKRILSNPEILDEAVEPKNDIK